MFHRQKMVLINCSLFFQTKERNSKNVNKEKKKVQFTFQTTVLKERRFLLLLLIDTWFL